MGAGIYCYKKMRYVENPWDCQDASKIKMEVQIYHRSLNVYKTPV